MIGGGGEVIALHPEGHNAIMENADEVPFMILRRIPVGTCADESS